MDIYMDIHEYIHIHKRLSCVHIATEFSRNTAVPERPFPTGISFVKLLKINKSKKNKTHLHWNMILEKYFPAVMEIYRNYFIALAIADR